ncbi:hypothetical protein MASR2M78_19390 [Treponema sp.]
MKATFPLRFGLVFGVSVLVFVSCASVAQIGTAVAASSGMINEEQAASINRSAVAVEKSFEDISPEQEYYIGRAVGANLLTMNKAFDAEAVTQYLNVLGQTLSRASSKPETFGGYHFLILDSDEINAFAAPGGNIFISRGMLRCTTNETTLAAVLAHEIAHVQYEHGLKAIKKDRLTSALAIVGAESAKTLGGQELKDLTSMFEGSITDITRTMVNSGYSRETEAQADEGALEILKKIGYNRAGLVLMLSEMKGRLKPGGADFAKTHPDPDIRIKAIQKKTGPLEPIKESDAMIKRYKAALGTL